MNYAYITLLSSVNYIKPILILNQNLKELHSQYSLYVMVTSDIINDVKYYLIKECIHYIEVPVIKYSKEIQEQYKNHSVLNTASKLNLFDLKEFDKVVYIDADSFFLKTIDELFNYPDGAMYDEGFDKGFSGLFVVCPYLHPASYYFLLIEKLPILDGDLLGDLFFPFKFDSNYRIPTPYFLNIKRQDFQSFSPIRDKIYGVHFCNKIKPWNYDSMVKFKNDFYKEGLPQSENRNNIIAFYFDHYLMPLKLKYPQLFKSEVNI